MKRYHIRRLINGYRLGKKYGGRTFVAIPKTDDGVQVFFDQGMMHIKDWKEREFELSFPDKFGRGEYTLGYFEWRPSEQIPLLI